MYKLMIVVLLGLLFNGCSHPIHYKLIDGIIKEPKVIVISARRLPWVITIENCLRDHGFKIKHAVSQYKIEEQTSPTKTAIYNKASTRYILNIDWSIRDRCFGGGFAFTFIMAEIIDTKTNEVISHYSNKGCSGTIFNDICEMVNGVWEQQ